MADVTGPIRTKPGSLHPVPAGMMCDGYNVEEEHNVPAVQRIQGETDSFGAEMCDYCQACVDKMRAEEAELRAEPKCCEWCKQSKTDCCLTRDFNEGDTGPLYEVCGACRQQQSKEAAEEIEYLDSLQRDRDHDRECDEHRDD